MPVIVQRRGDARRWAFLLGVVLIALSDLALPGVVVLLALLVIPVVASAILADARFTSLLTATALLCAAISAHSHAYPVGQMLVRGATISVAGVVAALLARRLRTTQTVVANTSDDLRVLAENASDIVYRANSDRIVTWISPSVQRVLGWAPEEVLGHAMAEFVNTEDREATEAARSLIYAGDASAQPQAGFPMRVRRKHGDELWMVVHMTPVGRDDDGAGVVGSLTDVHELMEARALAEDRGEQLRVAADAALEPQAVVRAIRDAEGHVADIQYCELNAAACEFVGADRDALLASTFQERTGGEFMHSGLFDHYANCLDTGTPVVLDSYPLKSIDGRTIFVDVRGARLSGDRLTLTWRDVTERWESAALLHASEERYRMMVENSSDVVVLVQDGRVEWVSPALTASLGWAPEEWEGQGFDLLVHEVDLDLAHGTYQRNAEGSTLVSRVRMRAKDGSWHWAEVHSGPYVDRSGATIGVVASFRLIDAEVAAEGELERRAIYDHLTGALQRNAALDRLFEASVSDAGEAGQRAALFVDVDEFKRVNDSLGHAAGDVVLQVLVRRIRDIVRGGDMVARIGGDEFLVVLEGMQSQSDAVAIAEKIRVAAAQPVQTVAGPATATVSVGVTMSRGSEDPDRLMARADAGMYAAKESGRNRVVAIDHTGPGAAAVSRGGTEGD